MAKITKEPQKIFCGGLTPTNNIAVFGSLKAGSPSYSGDPSTIQSAAYSLGWADAVVANEAPALQDMNALFFNDSYQLSYIMQQGGSIEWDAATIYFIGSYANDGTGGIFVSLTDNNLNNALTDGTKWSRVAGSVPRNISSATSATFADLLIQATGSSAYTLSLPAPTTLQTGKQFVIKSFITGGNNLTVNVTGGALIDGQATQILSLNSYITIYCTGTAYTLVSIPYESGSIDMSGSGTITSGTCYYTRTGDVVTLSFGSVVFPSSSSAATATGFLPSSLRPGVEQNTVVSVGGGVISRVAAESTGQLLFLTFGTSLTPTPATGSGFGSVTYNRTVS